jgi:MFS family permease
MLLSAVALPLMPNGWAAAAWLGVNILGSAGITAVSTAALMLITPNQLRGQVSAIYYFIISIFGLTLGPTAVAMLTDYLFADEAQLRYSLAIVGGCAGLVSVGAPMLFLKAYRAAVDEARQWDR